MKTILMFLFLSSCLLMATPTSQALRAKPILQVSMCDQGEIPQNIQRKIGKNYWTVMRIECIDSHTASVQHVPTIVIDSQKAHGDIEMLKPRRKTETAEQRALRIAKTQKF